MKLRGKNSEVNAGTAVRLLEVFENLRNSKLTQWREKLNEETKQLEKTRSKLSDSELLGKLEEVLSNAHELLNEFLANVLDPHKGMILSEEMEVVNKLAKMQAIIAQRSREVKLKEEYMKTAQTQLDNLKKQLEELRRN